MIQFFVHVQSFAIAEFSKPDQSDIDRFLTNYMKKKLIVSSNLEMASIFAWREQSVVTSMFSV